MDPLTWTLIALALVLVGAIVPAISLDVVAVLGLAILVLGGVLSEAEATKGFGSPTLITVACMFVLAEALQRTGAARSIGRLVERRAARGERALLVALLPIVMVLSAFMSNTGVVVLLLPILVAATTKAGRSPSRVLLPLSYASIAGGTLTLVGTTTTLLVDAMLRQLGQPGLGMLDILPIGAVVCVITFVYLVLAGPKVLPARVGLVVPLDTEATRQYLTQVLLGPGSRLVGRRVADVAEWKGRVRLLQVVRGEETFWPPFDDLVLQADDEVRLKGTPEVIAGLLAQPGVDGPALGDERVQGRDLALAEVLVAPGSRLRGMTVRRAGIRDRYGVTVLAVQRRGEHLRERIADLQMAVGDVLLVQGETEALARLTRSEGDLIALGGTLEAPATLGRAPHAIGIVMLALGLAAFGVLPLVVAALLGSLGVILAGCISATQAYRSLNLQVLFVLGTLLAFGQAADQSGLAQGVADGLIRIGGPLGPRGLLAMLFLATSVLTELVTNAGTAGMMIPIAIRVADQAGVSHEPFVFAVAIAASCSLLTPVGYQTNLLVFGPGGYRLQDYLKLGLPLTVMLLIASTLLLPVFYPF
ncbi:MAG: SLC13 family permease [Planctomycetes bacterium]|nr:SLC13 family permease [Planctomycetota bacterium]MCB9825519.1 SLC13 family permease [Planctomycetota bacterium]MCB9830681.1 SLC13 family permease [Planctomycetota bacterium]MCB9900613.1 SLC13 family permease [Planctomycetota bacterium]